jgi:hypothetical protein
MPGEGDAGERRARADRRERSAGHGADGGGRGLKRGPSGLALVLRSLGAIAVLVLVIVYAVANTRPIYSTRGKLGEELRRRAPGVASVIAPGDSTEVDQLMATPKFQDEKRNFYEDVMRLKQVDSARADSIAQYAVREAYVRGISPAIIFGVMLTENAKFISKAKSNVGAVGLMQVYPKIWLNKEMTKLFGHDLASDSTNVKYGVFILSQYFNPRTKNGDVHPRDWQSALLRYNGCVKGTNTPRCHTYPSKVQSFVENQAKSICDGRGFYDCIAKPFIDGLFTGTDRNGQRVAQASVNASPRAPASTAEGDVPVIAPAPVTPAPTSAPTAPVRTPALPALPAVPVVGESRAPVEKMRAVKGLAKAASKSDRTRSRRETKAAARKPVSKKPRKRESELRAPKPIRVDVPSGTSTEW